MTWPNPLSIHQQRRRSAPTVPPSADSRASHEKFHDPPLVPRVLTRPRCPPKLQLEISNTDSNQRTNVIRPHRDNLTTNVNRHIAERPGLLGGYGKHINPRPAVRH